VEEGVRERRRIGEGRSREGCGGVRKKGKEKGELMCVW